MDGGVKMNGLFRPAVDAAVGLLVAGKAVKAQLQGGTNWLLEHAGWSAAFG